MEAYNPDDQLATLKTWWKQYGKALIAGVVIGLLLLAGGNYWKQYTIKRAEAASLLYEGLLADLQQGKSDAVSVAATKLMQDYDATPYAGKSALLLARLRFDAKDIAGVRTHLEWAMRNATEAPVQHSARLRLARLLLDQGEYAAALALVNIKDTHGFISEYEEIRGDGLLAQGDREGARRAYQTAIEKLPRASSYLQALTMKRDNLGPEKAP
ncbi:MAG TPA: tetratricopeptide repeat protein [Acidiferrobacterales bacterium]|nr:tetratricopeptide repeat protein [Acidiferrobacterales bacterium]